MARIYRRKKILFILLAGIILTFGACSDNRPSQENQRASINKAFVLARDFAPGQLEAHYAKHKHEFGDITQQEYLSMARLLLNSAAGRDILEKARRNGDILRDRVSTGEFAVMAKDGRIRTYFKTDYKYWLKQ
ncbi:MAG: hypothetical protein PHY46_01045 [Candidatus Omnitrophica bacterium]|nr:hypothetical protein [Candidatus Omnitrophota bacterium]